MGCGMQCWNTQQYVQHAVSSHVQGPYQAADVTQPYMSTNPQAVLTHNGSILLAHIDRGRPVPGMPPWTNCTAGATPCCHGPSAHADITPENPAHVGITPDNSVHVDITPDHPAHAGITP